MGVPVQQPQDPREVKTMPGMVNAMAQSQVTPSNGFAFKTKADIYRMNDTDRTNYWKSLGEYAKTGQTQSDDALGHLQGLGDTLTADYSATESGRHNFYLTPEERMRGLQEMQAKDFRANLPGMRQQMANQVQEQAANSLQAGIKSTDQAASRRGLLYSGMNEGAKAGLRAQTSAKVGAAIGGINSDLERSAQDMESAAVNTGLGIQQAQQQIYNQAYSQALARMNASNQVAGSAMGMVGLGAILGVKGLMSKGD